jgi:hypothetical protein
MNLSDYLPLMDSQILGKMGASTVTIGAASISGVVDEGTVRRNDQGQFGVEDTNGISVAILRSALSTFPATGTTLGHGGKNYKIMEVTSDESMLYISADLIEEVEQYGAQGRKV